MSRTVVITGSASGIGQACAQLCRDRGWRVIGIDRNDPNEEGEPPTDLCLDLADPAARGEIRRFVEDASNGRIDALIACAGTVGEPCVRVNFFGMRDTLELLRPLLAQSDSPRAVAVTSASVLFDTDQAIIDACLAGDEALAHELGKANPKQAYPSSKVAMQQWVRRHAATAEWGGSGILLNIAVPGTVETPLVQPVLDSEEGRAWLKEAVPTALGRNASATEMAHALIWLVSPENSYMVGQNIFVDGGSEVILSERKLKAMDHAND